MNFHGLKVNEWNGINIFTHDGVVNDYEISKNISFNNGSIALTLTDNNIKQKADRNFFIGGDNDISNVNLSYNHSIHFITGKYSGSLDVKSLNDVSINGNFVIGYNHLRTNNNFNIYNNWITLNYYILHKINNILLKEFMG